VPDWRIYYADGSTFDGDPYEAPGSGVIVIIQRNPDVGFTLLRGRDWYWYEGHWFGGDMAGLTLYCVDHKGPQKVLLGKFVGDRQFHDIIAKSLVDPDFPPKSAWCSEDDEPPGR
jgi:hypothetical protein